MLTIDSPGRLTDRIVRDGDPGWDAARGAFNLLVDQRPAAIVPARDERDVVAAVRHARARGLRVAPQGTGHGAAALGDLSDAVIVNASALASVRIDAERRTVRVGSGAIWRQVAPPLSDLGLAALHGSSPDVGIAGYSLGGGIGWLARRHGMQANSVTAIELVTADGDLVRTDASSEPELFWALRGGGGNFGVVTAIEFRVLPLPELYAGTFVFPFARAADVLHAWNDLLPSLPDELMSWATLFHLPDAPDMPPELRGASLAVVMAAYLGGEAEGRELLTPLRRLGPAEDTFATAPPAVLAGLAMEDPVEPFPFLTAHGLLGDMPAGGIDALLDAAGPGSPAGTSLAMVQLRHMGGALARRAPGAGARATLPGTLSLLALGIVEDEAGGAAVRDALGAVGDATAAHRVGDYPNFVERPADASAFWDAATWRRLRAVKAAYDPEDLFRGNHHIPPAAREG
jgi:FAD/FMN-containing dehydrogenase